MLLCSSDLEKILNKFSGELRFVFITSEAKVLSENGEGEESDVEFVVIIKEEQMKLSKNAKHGDPVEVTYSYDTNGVMHCVFKEMKSKNSHEMVLKPEGSKDFKELKENLDFEIE